MTTREKAKRSRKSAPKVRTGCGTCKTRHLKCGEERPICLRCRSDGFTCDGYPAASTTAVFAQPKSKKKALALQLSRQINYDISGSALEKLYFHHVRECTIGNLGFSSTHTDFWTHLVLPTAHGDSSVKHALVALGMAHRTFIGSAEGDSLHELMLQQYNAAIRHLTDSSKGAGADTRETLICCLIFFCLETILGHYAQSLQHLRSGSRLLFTHLESTRCSSGENSKLLEDSIAQIADVFAVLGVDAGFFMDENLTPGLRYGTLPDMNDELLGMPFKDLVDARKHVNAIVVDFNHTVEMHRHDWYAPEMCVLYERFKRWARRFDRTTFKFANDKPTQAEQHELVSMRIARKLWMAVIDQDDKVIPTSNPEYDSLFNQILDEAEELIKELAAVSHPVFSLQADTVPPLAYICDLNSDPAIQQRAINLLRSVKRREGIWDSQEVAEYLEDYVLAKQLYQMNWDDLPGGVPGQVRVISGLNLSTLGPRNGIMKLAAQGIQDAFGFGPLPVKQELLEWAEQRVSARQLEFSPGVSADELADTPSSCASLLLRRARTSDFPSYISGTLTDLDRFQGVLSTIDNVQQGYVRRLINREVDVELEEFVKQV
jgi:hypothetical protein